LTLAVLLIKDAANLVVYDALPLVEALQEISHDSIFSFSAKSPDQETFVHDMDPFVAREARGRRVHERRALEPAAKMRRSHRLAAKKVSNSIDMMEKAMRIRGLLTLTSLLPLPRSPWR
jgi:hypothetical protein